MTYWVQDNYARGIGRFSISRQSAKGSWQKVRLPLANPDFKKGNIKNSSGVWSGDLREQRGPFEARGQAAYRGWTVCFAWKMGLVAGTLFFWFAFFPRRDAYA